MRPDSDIQVLSRREISEPGRSAGKRAASCFLFGVACIALISDSRAADIEWQRSKDTIACQGGGRTVWQFSFATNKAKPFIHPLCLRGSDSLTTSQPGDHRWHYGLWFSWKYINGVNYWEENKETGKAEGATHWDPPEIETQADGSAKISMHLRYISTNDHQMMTEQREIVFSAARKDGGVTIDWTGRFTAGDEELVLDRTPMPGEPHGAVNGGYAGFAFRAAQTPAKCDFLTIEGPVNDWKSDRARPNSKAAACNVTQNSRTDGAAIFSAVSNTGGDAPWYMVNSSSMHWFSPSLLAPAPKKVKARESFAWKFRVVTKEGAWTPEQLAHESSAYNRSK
jgi:hypothetical protein